MKGKVKYETLQFVISYIEISSKEVIEAPSVEEDKEDARESVSEINSKSRSRYNFCFHFMFLKHIFSPIDSNVYSLSSSPLKGENISKEVNENRKDEKGNNCRSNFIEFLDEL